jgi:hypothetical protein
MFKAKGQALDSFVKYLIKHQQEYELSANELAYLAGTIFGAGSDTVGIQLQVTSAYRILLSLLQTASAISPMVMAAVAFPEAQKKVQEELDLVIGPSRGQSFRLFALTSSNLTL